MQKWSRLLQIITIFISFRIIFVAVQYLTPLQKHHYFNKKRHRNKIENVIPAATALEIYISLSRRKRRR
jgi:hypothetical protein